MSDIVFPKFPPDFSTWKDTESMIVKHLELMDKQLVQVRELVCESVYTGLSHPNQ